MQVTTIGLDIAKSVFQAHGVDASGAVVIQKRLARAELVRFFKKQSPCLIGIEACSTAHFWARELNALGHTVKLVPAQYVKAYVKRVKNDAADAEAICEAVTRPNMRFVPVKTPEAQAIGSLHTLRLRLARQRVAMLNCLRSGLAEYGVIAPSGLRGASALLKEAEAGSKRVPKVVRGGFRAMAKAVRACEAHLDDITDQLAEAAKSENSCARLGAIPGVGPISASAIVALGGDLSRFPSGRHFAAWIGLTPRQHSSGEKVRMGHITKAGNRTLRHLLVYGALVHIWRTKAPSPWLSSLLERRPQLVAAVAMANKAARIAWAIIVRGETYRRLIAA